MKALSIRQPYAFAITMGFKPVENRDWATRFRGPVLIHAGKREEIDDVESVIAQISQQTGVAREVIAKGYANHRWLGCIAGAARIVDCVTEMDSPWFHGRYGFIMADPVWGNRVECKGALGFFDVPDDVLAQLHLPPYVDALSSYSGQSIHSQEKADDDG